MRLSRNFNLTEFISSNTATRQGYAEQMIPPDKVVDNLKTLCIELLQPLRDALPSGHIRVSSGYRCERLNKRVGGAETSQHLTGCAADVQYINADGVMQNYRIIELVQKLNLPFDQMINEFNLSWVHLSYVEGKNRKQTLKIG